MLAPRPAAALTLLLTVALLPPAFAAEDGWRSLFNGRDLTGWTVLAGAAPYVVEDGAIVGTTVADSPNSFLATTESFGDFVLEAEVRQDGGPSNSGIQFRSAFRTDASRVYGYQFEIDPTPRAWTGGIYDEARSGWLYPVDLNPGAKPLYQLGQWNQIRIEAIGPSLRTWINGQPVSHLIDATTAQGFIALQVHSIGPAAEAGRRVAWRHLRIRTTDLTPAPPAAIPIRNTVPNLLTDAERAAGWRLLWDGTSTAGWRAAGGTAFPGRGWVIRDGALVIQATPKGAPRAGDIVTEATFDAFELQLEFKLSAGANSGIKYFVEERPAPDGVLGLEYQLLDDERHPDATQGRDGNRTLASLYDLIPRGPLPRSLGIAPRVDHWQQARLVVRADQHVEHWLNGIKVLEYQRGSSDFATRVSESKYAPFANFGRAPAGPILLQDHGDEVQFRSIKVRPLR